MVEKKRVTVKQIRQLLERQIAKDERYIEHTGGQQATMQGLILLEHAEARKVFSEHLLDIINGKIGRGR